MRQRDFVQLTPNQQEPSRPTETEIPWFALLGSAFSNAPKTGWWFSNTFYAQTYLGTIPIFWRVFSKSQQGRLRSRSREVAQKWIEEEWRSSMVRGVAVEESPSRRRPGSFFLSGRAFFPAKSTTRLQAPKPPVHLFAVPSYCVGRSAWKATENCQGPGSGRLQIFSRASQPDA